MRPFRASIASVGTAWIRTFRITDHHSPSRIGQLNIPPALTEAQNIYNIGVIYAALLEGVVVTQALCHRTSTLIAPSLKVRTLARIPQQPCNGNTVLCHDVISSSPCTRGPLRPHLWRHSPNRASSPRVHLSRQGSLTHAASNADGTPSGSTETHASSR